MTSHNGISPLWHRTVSCVGVAIPKYAYMRKMDHFLPKEDKVIEGAKGRKT